MNDRIRQLIRETQQSKHLFAQSKELLIARIAALIEVSDPKFDLVLFYNRHLNDRQELNKDWINKVCIDAINLLD